MNSFAEFYREVLCITKEIRLDEELKNHTSFKIGGKCKALIEPKNVRELKKILKLIKKYNLKHFIIGNGTNLLVRDKGFDGVIIKFSSKFKFIRKRGLKVYASSGVSLFEFNKFLKDNALGGMEFSYGIPGSIGGAVYMNAGAYNGEIKQFVTKVKVLIDGKIKTIKNKDMNFGYRTSIIKNSSAIVLGAEFKLEKSTSKIVEEKQNEFMRKRLAKQPYDAFSAGSVFKREPNFFISKLIEELGLKGYSVGGAMVSKKHAGFIINTGNSTCKDVLKLIKYISTKIQDNYGFTPSLEIKVLGEE